MKWKMQKACITLLLLVFLVVLGLVYEDRVE
jgi:hypothetical protein